MLSNDQHYFSDERANAISEATRNLSSTFLADTVLDGIGAFRGQTLISPPITYNESGQGLIALCQKLSGIHKITVKVAKKRKFKTRPLVHSCVEIIPGRQNFLMGKKTEAVITYRSDLSDKQINFAVVKECAHVLIRKALADGKNSILANWPDMREQQLDIVEELSSEDLLSVELDDEPLGITPQKRAIWHLERKATRLAMRILVPKYSYKEMMINLRDLKKAEGEEFLEEWCHTLNEFHLKLPADKFRQLVNEEFSFLDYA